MDRTIACLIIFVAFAGLAPPGCETAPDGSVKGPGFIEDLLPPSPSEAARDAFNVYDADRRRKAVALLSNASFGGEAPYVRTYRLLVDDPDPTVRATCLSALGRHGAVSDVPAIADALADQHKPVRWEAAKALQKLHSDQAIDPLIRTLNADADVDVRMAAANALAQYRYRRVFDALVTALDDPDYGVVIEARNSLRTLTGVELGVEHSEWSEWARENQGLFEQALTYHYPQYQKPPSLLDRAMFWEDDSVQPKQPRGLAPEPEELPTSAGMSGELSLEPGAEGQTPVPAVIVVESRPGSETSVIVEGEQVTGEPQTVITQTEANVYGGAETSEGDTGSTAAPSAGSTGNTRPRLDAEPPAAPRPVYHQLGASDRDLQTPAESE